MMQRWAFITGAIAFAAACAYPVQDARSKDVSDITNEIDANTPNWFGLL
jgi:hypothetical protein